MIRIFAGLVLAFAAQGVLAFHVPEHQRITRQAHLEFARCFPDVGAEWTLTALISGNTHEDTNLIEKHFIYSHYYHPQKKLRMLRHDSAGRIEVLAPHLQQCRAAAEWKFQDLVELGHAIHHFQDVTVPSHVVPVSHSFWDGFEGFEYEGDISSGLSCAEIQTMNEDLSVILRETAEQTLSAVRNYSVDVVQAESGLAVRASGRDFWVEASDNSFGDYGNLGNNFGESEFVQGGNVVRVNPDAYRIFKHQQLVSAVRATLRGMAWALSAGR